jgi:hypothetical protein
LYLEVSTNTYFYNKNAHPLVLVHGASWAETAGSLSKFSCPFNGSTIDVSSGTFFLLLYFFIVIFQHHPNSIIGIPTGDDTVGALLDRDMVWTIPGMEHVNQVKITS